MKNNNDELTVANNTVPTLIRLRNIIPIITTRAKLTQTAIIQRWNPRNISLMNKAANGIIKARCFFFKVAPPNRARAAIGVKLGQWGINLIMAPNKIILPMTIILGCTFNLFIVTFDLG